MLVELDGFIVDTEDIRAAFPRTFASSKEVCLTNWEVKLKGDFKNNSIIITRKGYENLKSAIKKG